MKNFELLGSFYLGCRYEFEGGLRPEEPLLYDAKDLTTHAVCVGMTGSGKTGLGISLLEEAAIDGVPSIVIDPKGDMGNLLLAFPDLSPSDFLPWIDDSEGARHGRTPLQQAEWTANLWCNGLGEWGQSPERIGMFVNSVERVLYTPGSNAARPIALLRSLTAPKQAVLDDPDLFRSRIQSTVSGLLALLGMDLDPLQSREHILLSTILDGAWREGRDLDLPNLIRSIQTPPFERVGVFDLESFYPGKDRFGLAMTLNNLLASPGFSVWTEGDPLDVGKLLYGTDGKPKMSILSIAHLSESERMFFVTLLLNEVLSWIRTQPGSRTLRALLYMDEIFGYFPPVANPPSKTAMLTLLKQARAYGLGIVLATQNPVDLDYKGLSNAGTWFIGRLQTERDKQRVMEGLEGAAASQSGFDRSKVEETLAGLGNRVFLMNNVHEDGPVLFQTRWALSYLGGPLSLEQIKRLVPDAPGPAPQIQSAATPAAASTPIAENLARPILPPEIQERFLPQRLVPSQDEHVVYRPALMGSATVHYTNSRVGVDQWSRMTLLAPLEENGAPNPWIDSIPYPGDSSALDDEPADQIAFEALPAKAQNVKAHDTWKKMLTTHLYRDRPLRLRKSKSPSLISRPDESEEEFRGRIQQILREDRDLAVGKVREKFEARMKRLDERVRAAMARVEKQQTQLQEQKFQTAISFGSTLMGALFGRKLTSATQIGKAATAMRGVGRTATKRQAIAEAEDRVEDLQSELTQVEEEMHRELDLVRQRFEAGAVEIEELPIRATKSDITIEAYHLAWAPWAVSAGGARPLY